MKNTVSKIARSRILRFIVLFTLILPAKGSRPGTLFTAETAPTELPRKILALYNSKSLPGTFKDIYFTKIHQYAEMPLNHLGMEVTYGDIQQELPPVNSLTGYRGVLTWFAGPADVPDKENYCQWLSAISHNGIRVVFLGHPGFTIDSKASALSVCQNFLKSVDVHWEGTIEMDPATSRILRSENDMVEFERRLDITEFNMVPKVYPSPTVASSLQISHQDLQNPLSPVFTTDKISMALDPFVLYDNSSYSSGHIRWRLNPFEFFNRAFSLQKWPRPDTTTLNGRRLYYSHIDGDGIFNLSEVKPGEWSAQVFFDEILLRYSRSPFTVGIITGYYENRLYSSPQAIELTKKILSQPHVEPAAHGYTHPLIWHTGKLAIEIPGYRLDAKTEIYGSLDYINTHFARPNRTAKIFLWTGDCLPIDQQMAVLNLDKSVLNLNGGDSRFDRFFNSHCFLAPLSRPVGNLRQIYSSAVNETPMTHNWHGPFYLYRHILETFQNTETPRRLKPVNIYTHFYSAEKIAGLKALREVYDWAHQQNLFPIQAGEYARIANDFFKIRIFQTSPQSFSLTSGNHIRCVRFDDETRVIDMKRSRGVLGFQTWQNSLYVFLDETGSHEIVLTSFPQKEPHLVESNFHITGWRTEGNTILFFRRGWWKGECVLGGLKPGGNYLINSASLNQKRLADEKGRLSISFPDAEGGTAPTPVRVESL